MLYAIAAVLAVILDQAVKYWTTVNIVVDTGEAKLIPGLVHLANVHNLGAAFSFLSGARWFFVILCLIFVLVVVYALAKDLITHPVCRWSAVFVMAGAIGNCIDRIVCGYVVDMFELDFLIFKHPFPVFNVADIFITLGVIVFCVALLLEKPAAADKSSGGADAKAEKSQAKAAKAAAAASAPAAQRKPAVRHRQKTEIPTFPKREIPQAPAMDPNDPFAEWEKRANAVQTDSVPSGTTVYTRPIVSQAAPTEITAAPAVDAPKREQQPQVTTTAAENPTPADKAPETKPAVKAAEAVDEFDLDSILAEFKDL